MTIYRNFLARGYFPKELPPSFFTSHFAAYAVSAAGRVALEAYAPQDNFTECVSYNLALPGLSYRQLAIPHPHTFARLSALVAKDFRRLLKKAGVSHLSKSRPIYQVRERRALRTLFKPTNLAKERAIERAGAAFLLKVDVSQFYPSLYTHAVGWAIDPKLRLRANWNDWSLLGKRIDQCLMNLQGKVSQGIPIGNDISFLLAEIVLGQVDKGLGLRNGRGHRWYDDYEISCDTRSEAEETLARLQKGLDRFRLRVNPQKTRIVELPRPAGDAWHEILNESSKTAFANASAMVRYFDTTFELAAQNRELPVLSYSLGTLFRKSSPEQEVFRVAQSCITQALLSEPGCAQKGLALLRYWALNGCALDDRLLAHTIERIVVRHERRGPSSDIAWALAFSIEHGLRLSSKTGRVLSSLDDDVIAIQSLHADSLGLVGGFRARVVEEFLKKATCDGNNWLALYEAVRHGFLPSLAPVVNANPLFASLLQRGVTFYRRRLPPYSMVLHTGGAPDWIVSEWIKAVVRDTPDRLEELFGGNVVLALVGADIQNMPHDEKNEVEIVRGLLGISEPESFAFEFYE